MQTTVQADKSLEKQNTKKIIDIIQKEIWEISLKREYDWSINK